MSSEGVPFKYNPNLTHQEAVSIAGLIYDLILYSKRTIDEMVKKPSPSNMTLRMRLKNGEEIIVSQGKQSDLNLRE